jgi:hypothetical protein
MFYSSHRTELLRLALEIEAMSAPPTAPSPGRPKKPHAPKTSDAWEQTGDREWSSPDGSSACLSEDLGWCEEQLTKMEVMFLGSTHPKTLYIHGDGGLWKLDAKEQKAVIDGAEWTSVGRQMRSQQDNDTGLYKHLPRDLYQYEGMRHPEAARSGVKVISYDDVLFWVEERKDSSS